MVDIPLVGTKKYGSMLVADVQDVDSLRYGAFLPLSYIIL